MHPKIEETSTLFLTEASLGLLYYGHFLSYVTFNENNKIRTFGVDCNSKGMNFHYNSNFFDERSQEEVNFFVLHGIFHLLWNHSKRMLKGGFEKELANITQDMIINSTIVEDIPKHVIEIPENMCVFIPKEYKDEAIFEILYNWLYDQREKEEEESSGYDIENGDDNVGEERDDENEDIDNDDENSIGLDEILDDLDENKGEYLDNHIDDEIPTEEREVIIENVLENLKTRGVERYNITDILNKLRKKNKDYLSYVKKAISASIFGSSKRKTITKLNRKGIEGLKGKRKNKNTINVLLDTSGSMDTFIDSVLNYVFKSDISINLIEADTQVNYTKKLSDGKKLQKTIISGGGGTIIQSGVNYIIENFNKFATVILTDGYTDALELKKLKKNVLIISIGVNCPILTTNGKLKQILVKK
jgi:predicted metal-dependent peptidase